MDTLHVSKDKGRFDLKPVTDCFWDLPDGLYRVEIKRHRARRSNDQNAYLWGVVYPAALQGFIDLGWTTIVNTEQVHEYFKREFLSREFVNIHTGEVVSLPDMSTAGMNTEQFSVYIDQVVGYCLENMGVVVPPADSKY